MEIRNVVSTGTGRGPEGPGNDAQHRMLEANLNVHPKHHDKNGTREVDVANIGEIESCAITDTGSDQMLPRNLAGADVNLVEDQECQCSSVPIAEMQCHQNAVPTVSLTGPEVLALAGVPGPRNPGNLGGAPDMPDEIGQPATMNGAMPKTRPDVVASGGGIGSASITAVPFAGCEANAGGSCRSADTEPTTPNQYRLPHKKEAVFHWMSRCVV